MRESVPDRRAAPIFVHRAFHLIRSRRRPPKKSLGKGTKRRHRRRRLSAGSERKGSVRMGKRRRQQRTSSSQTRSGLQKFSTVQGKLRLFPMATITTIEGPNRFRQEESRRQGRPISRNFPWWKPMVLSNWEKAVQRGPLGRLPEN
jgi:hypothetical protein